MEIFTSPQFHVWLLALVYLYFKMNFSSVVQGYSRFTSKQFKHPEDAALFGKGKGTSGNDAELTNRASDVWRNDLENIPLFLFLSLGYVLAGGDYNWCVGYFAAFCFARTLHTIFFLKPMQPARNLSFNLGALVCVCLAIALVRIAIGGLA